MPSFLAVGGVMIMTVCGDPAYDAYSVSYKILNGKAIFCMVKGQESSMEECYSV
jgi:hypothetical protein